MFGTTYIIPVMMPAIEKLTLVAMTMFVDVPLTVPALVPVLPAMAMVVVVMVVVVVVVVVVATAAVAAGRCKNLLTPPLLIVSPLS